MVKKTGKPKSGKTVIAYFSKNPETQIFGFSMVKYFSHIFSSGKFWYLPNGWYEVDSNHQITRKLEISPDFWIDT